MDPVTGLFADLVAAGPLGLFFASILANASILLPLPVDILLVPIATIDFFGLGVWTPLILGLIVATGSTIGETTSYILGMGGRVVLKKFKKEHANKIVEIGKELSGRGWEINFFGKKFLLKGIPILIVFAFTPLPFDLAGIAAGIVHYPINKFLLGCWLGKVPRYILIAYAGYFGMHWILTLLGVPSI